MKEAQYGVSKEEAERYMPQQEDEQAKILRQNEAAQTKFEISSEEDERLGNFRSYEAGGEVKNVENKEIAAVEKSIENFDQSIKDPEDYQEIQRELNNMEFALEKVMDGLDEYRKEELIDKLEEKVSKLLQPIIEKNAINMARKKIENPGTPIEDPVGQALSLIALSVDDMRRKFVPEK